jgi:3-deoxy-D-arabino-heptulosonate 7-phosphate (DAHP) synthase
MHPLDAYVGAETTVSGLEPSSKAALSPGRQQVQINEYVVLAKNAFGFFISKGR